MNNNPKNNILISENIRQKSLFCLIFSDITVLFSGLLFTLYVLQLSERNGFWILPWLEKLSKKQKCLIKLMYNGNFHFLEEGLGLVFPLHFVYNFSRKKFLMLYSINLPDVIVWLSLFLEILSNMCIASVCFLS